MILKVIVTLKNIHTEEEIVFATIKGARVYMNKYKKMFKVSCIEINLRV